jgi:hypothetical protein
VWLQVVIELVLATDMKQHFSILSHFTTVHRLNAGGAMTPGTSGSDPMLALRQQARCVCLCVDNRGCSVRACMCAARQSLCAAKFCRQAFVLADLLHRPPVLACVALDMCLTSLTLTRHALLCSPTLLLCLFPVNRSDNSTANSCGGDQDKIVLPLDDNERVLGLQMALKCADVGHVTAALPVHIR